MDDQIGQPTVAARVPAPRKGPLATVAIYGRLVRFSHTVFALPFALMAVFLAAGGWPGWGRLGLILACMVSARSAAMTFNRIADVRIDAANPRTAGRPIQRGLITLPQAWAFWLGCCAAFVLACAGFWWLWGNPWPAILALPTLGLLCGYSLAKRVTWACHLMLGASLGFSPLAAWIALSPQTLGWPAVLLALAVVCWVGGFDIIYALQDLQIDRRQGLVSIPVRFGPAGALWISRGLHAVTIVLLAAMGRALGMGLVYWTGVALAAVLLAVEQSLVRPHDLRRVGAAFFHANAAMSLLLAATTIADVLLR